MQTPMRNWSLSEAIAVFRREIESALASSAAGSAGAAPAWQADRVTLNLAVVVDADGALRVAPAGSGSDGVVHGNHSVAIEFRLGRGDAGVGLSGSGSSRAGVETGVAGAPAAATGSVEGLSALFGAPGFDSSARASVFCEVMGGLPAERARALASALAGPASEAADADLRRSRHLLLGIVQSGPLKSAAKASVLLGTLLGSMTPDAIVAGVRAAWRTDDHW